jgi:gas vesicle protein
MKTNASKNTAVIIVATAAAAAAGYAAGLLLAPKTGKQTRAMLRTRVKKAQKNVIKTTKATQQDIIKNARNVKRGVTNNISSLDTLTQSKVKAVADRLHSTAIPPKTSAKRNSAKAK